MTAAAPPLRMALLRAPCREFRASAANPAVHTGPAGAVHTWVRPDALVGAVAVQQRVAVPGPPCVQPRHGPASGVSLLSHCFDLPGC